MGDKNSSKHVSLSTSDDESDLLKDFIERSKSGEKASSSNNNVFTREELEEKSNLSRAKLVEENAGDIKSTEHRTKSKSVSSSKGILKNGSKRDYSASFRLKKFSENVTALEKPEEFVFDGMKTNLEIDCWSVASFDTCSADVKRTYAKQFAIRIGRWFTNAKSLAIFKNKQGMNFSVPMHEKSDFEDDEPYGPHDPESSFYKRKRKERMANKRKSKIRKIRSLASFSMKSGKPGRNSSGGATRVSRVARLSKQFSRESTKHSEEGGTIDVMNRIKGKAEGYIPPDMTYDPTYNNGKGGLVNKEPAVLPPNKIWSKSANNGKGGVINKPPQPHTIPPGLIWSRSAFNGQGGLVNCKPEEIPDGKMWDFNAENGMGALVEASESYLLRLKKKQNKLRGKQRRSQRKKIRKVKSHGKIRISGTRDELLRELNEENEKIFAEIDAEEERVRQVEKNSSAEKLKIDHPKSKDLDENGVPPNLKYVAKDDDGSVLIMDEQNIKRASIQGKLKNHSQSGSDPANTSGHRRTSFSSRRKSIYSTAKSVISQSIKKISKKSIQLRKSVLLATADRPANKEKAKKLGIEEGKVAQMFETFESMSLKTDDAVRASDSDSSSSGSEIM